MATLRSAVVLALTLGAGATTASAPAQVPAAAQADFERCRSVLVEWCHGVAHGDPPQERACLDDAARQYAAAGSAPARNQYLFAHGCRP